MERFDVVTGAWVPCAPMPHARRDFAAFACANGEILAAGGWGPDGPIACVDKSRDARLKNGWDLRKATRSNVDFT